MPNVASLPVLFLAGTGAACYLVFRCLLRAFSFQGVSLNRQVLRMFEAGVQVSLTGLQEVLPQSRARTSQPRGSRFGARYRFSPLCDPLSCLKCM
jgi:hypothetical protein